MFRGASSEPLPQGLLVALPFFIQGGNINASDASPASIGEEISEQSDIAGPGYFVNYTSRGGLTNSCYPLVIPPTLTAESLNYDGLKYYQKLID